MEQDTTKLITTTTARPTTTTTVATKAIVDTCAVCGAVDVRVLPHEAWAGTWHSACFHAACADCLHAHIDSQLSACTEAKQLRIQCFACEKSLPQKLVLTVSSAARLLAEKVDNGICCTPQTLKDELAMLDPPPPHGACGLTPLYSRTDGARPCPICCNDDAEVQLTAYCGVHVACAPCMQKWVDDCLGACAARKDLRVPCIHGAACGATVPRDLVASLTPSATRLAAQLARRKELQENKLFPKAVQVDCVDPACVGLGYLGFDQIMCFICETQWDAQTFEARMEGTSFDGFIGPSGAAVVVKACPKCGVRICKEGGCDHMTCVKCRHEWWWTTGQPYRT